MYMIIFMIVSGIAWLFLMYKIVRNQIKKASERNKKILKEYEAEERTNALKIEKKKNTLRALFIYLIYLLGFPIICLIVLLFAKTFPHEKIRPLGSYLLFQENGISYYGNHDYSIFCYSNGFEQFSSYKIFEKKEKNVFETNSYEKFLTKLEDLFREKKIKKINFYGTCLADLGYRSLGYALKKSTLIKSHEIEDLEEKQLIHVETANGVKIEIEYLNEDMICTCRGV